MNNIKVLKVAKQRQKHLSLPIQSEFIVPSNSQTVDPLNNFYDAFISYGRADSKPFAIKLHERLTAQGLNVWFDQEDIEDSVKWQKEIDKGIEKTHNFIFIVAPHAVKSPYCRAEIELAVKYNKRLIPLLHIEPSDCWDKVHPAIGEIQFIPFQEGINDFESSFNRLLNSLRKYANYIEQHTNFLVKALDWSRNHKQTNYLLIGEELTQAESWLKRNCSITTGGGLRGAQCRRQRGRWRSGKMEIGKDGDGERWRS
ncbi:MAG: toll/interleukin-1 receptor domain-containing protein, partial [Xenococcaceae cyanobacterium]